MLGHRTLNVEDYLIILKRRWWIFVLFAIAGPAVAVAVTYFITPKYVSETLVLIDQQKVPRDFVQPVVTQSLDSRLAIIDEQVLSRSNLQPIIEKYNLYGSEHLSMDERVDRIRKGDLKVEAVHSEIANSNGLPGFKIAFTANDPQTAQQVCGDITALFTKTNLQSRQANAESTTDFLKEQYNVATQNLNDLDTKVAAFQRQYAGALPEDQQNNTNIINTLNSSLDATTQQLQTLEQNKRVYETELSLQQSNQPVPSSPTAVPTQSTGTLQKQLDALLTTKDTLEAEYKDDYPDVKDVNRRIADLQKQIAKEASAPAPAATSSAPKAPDTPAMVMLRSQISGVDQLIAAKLKEQQSLQQEIRGYEGRMSMSPQVEAQYKELTRDYDTATAFQKRILDEMNQSEMTTSLENRQEGETFSILDAPSLPTEPIWPKKIVFAGGGFGVGLMLAMGLIALMEYKDTALRTERDIWDFTQLPTLAVIAWSGDVALMQPVKRPRRKRLFGRKPPNDLLADTTG